jgi:hypothetical protein
MLACAAVSPAAQDFVAGNLDSISMRHLKRLKSKNKGTAIVLRKEEDIQSLVTRGIDMIRKRRGNDCSRVAFTVAIAIDATCVVPGHQVIKSVDSTVIIGGAHPNHSMDITNLNDNERATFVTECAQGKKGDRAVEVKVAVVSFQDTPLGMCPYIIAGALPQTNNAVNDWGMGIIKACTSAAAEAKNAVLLNVATDGVKSETCQIVVLVLSLAILAVRSNKY